MAPTNIMPSIAMLMTPERSLINPDIAPRAIGVALINARVRIPIKNRLSIAANFPLPKAR